MIRRHLITAVMIAWMPAVVAIGQTNPNLQRGFDASKAFQFGDVDSINLFNGNMVLGVPLGLSYPVGGGLSFGMKLFYNSQGVWDYSTRVKPFPTTVEYTVAELSGTSNAGMGWELSLGRLCWPDCTNPGVGAPISFVYESPDGGTHRFWSTLHVGETPDPTHAYWYTRDGSYLRLEVVARDSGGYPQVAKVEFPDGRMKTFGSSAGANGVLRLQKIEDRSGNWIQVSYATPDTWAISDSQGRSYRVYFRHLAGCSSEVDCTVVDRVEEPGFSGGISTYTFSYQVRQIDRSCLDQRKEVTGRDPGNPFAPFLVAITRPDGSTWKMGDGSGGWYHTENLHGNDGSCSAGTAGALYMLEGPLGSRWHWEYGSFKYPSGDVNFLVYGMGVVTRQVTTGGVTATWGYDRPPAAPLAETVTTTVTSPRGDDTVYYFDSRWNVDVSGGIWLGWDDSLPYTRDPAKKNGDLFLSREEYAGHGASRVLTRKIYYRYEHDKLAGDPQYDPPVDDPGVWYDSNRRLKEVKTLFVDDGGRWRDTLYTRFDGLGHYRDATTSASSNWSSTQRKASTEFNPGSGTYAVDAETNQYTGNTFVPWPTGNPWILNTLTKKDVVEGWQTSRSEYCFSSATGLMLRKRVLKNFGTVRSSHDIITTYTYDSHGDLVTERSYGGDFKAVGTGPLCTTTLGPVDYQIDTTYQYGVVKTSKHHGQPYFDLDRDIDRNTGLVRTERDTTGLATDMTYDGLGRVTARKPRDGGWTYMTYSYNPPRVHVTYRQYGGGSILAEEEVRFDGLGRISSERRKMPGGSWAEKLTRYTLTGTVSKVSTWGALVGTKHWTVYSNYDRWGRPGRITQPDGKAFTLAYAGVRQQQRTVRIGTSRTGTTPFTVTTTKDPFGRTVRVTEPTGSGTNTSTYTYDAGNHLTQVRISTANGTQTRSFNYDNRGFLLWERLPEKGSSGNGYVHWYDYDSPGHAHRVVDGPNDLTSVYDSAERLTEIEETATGRILETRTYGIANDWSGRVNRRKGKLIQAVRHNFYNGVGDSSELRVEENYEYRGVGGRVSKRRTTVTLVGAYTTTFDQGFTWTPLGALQALDYPTRVGDGNWRSGGPQRQIQYGYDEGLVTSVPGYATSIGYHWNGMVKQVEHATGFGRGTGSHVMEFRDADPWGMARVRRIHTANATSNWDSGIYSYDGAGNITKIGSNWYGYDGLSRLKQGTARLSNGSVSARIYQYDGFGNLTSLDGRSIGVNHATNRLTGSSYDAAGNELSWGAGGLSLSYVYYPTGGLRMISGGSPAVNRLYGYTADGERIAAYANTGPGAGVTYTIRDLEGHVLRQFLENSGNWTWQQDHIWGPTGLLATVSSTGSVRHFINDHLGSPRLVCDQFGRTVARHNYYPYGEEATYADQDREPIKFTGQERDLNLDGQTTDDLDYMHTRHYTFHLGRFMSVDPLGGSIGSSQSWNRYSYVNGNPINATDPTGMLRNNLGGPGDLPVNLANAGTSVTEFDWEFTSVPLTPYVAGVAVSNKGFYLGLTLSGQLLVLDAKMDIVEPASVTDDQWVLISQAIVGVDEIHRGLAGLVRSTSSHGMLQSDLTEAGGSIQLGNDARLHFAADPPDRSAEKETVGFRRGMELPRFCGQVSSWGGGTEDGPPFEVDG